MICDICKENESDLFLQKNNGLKKKKYYICFECSQKLGISSDSSNVSEAFTIVEKFINERNKRSLKQGIINTNSTTDDNTFKSTDLPNLTKICPVCGTSIQSIFDQGKIGCSECYHTFEDEFINQYKLSNEYTGNLPKRLKGYRSILTDRVDIRMKLERAIANEEYEKAALYRDYLKVLERKQNLNGEEE